MEVEEGSSKQNHDVATDYFRLIKKALWYCGVPIDRNPIKLYYCYTFFGIFGLMGTMIIMQIPSLFRVKDMDNLLDIMVYQTGYLSGFVKGTYLFVKRKQILGIMQKLESGTFLPDQERGGAEEGRLINDCVGLTKKMGWVYWGSCALSVFITITTSLVKRLSSSTPDDWTFPFGTVTAIDVSYSPNYEYALAYQITGVILVTSFYTTCDMLIAAIFFHLTTQLKILQLGIKRIPDNAFKAMEMEERTKTTTIAVKKDIEPSSIPWKYLEPKMKQVIAHHNAILDLVQETEDTFSMLILLVFSINLVTYCLLLWQISMTSPQDEAFLYKIMTYFSAAFLFFAICYCGNEITQESQAIAAACWDVNFVGADTRLQDGLQIMMLRSQKPTIFTAGGLQDVNVSTFVSLMKVSYTYFTVLNRINSNER